MGWESEADIAVFFAGGHDSKMIRKLMKLNSSAEICPRLSPQKKVMMAIACTLMP